MSRQRDYQKRKIASGKCANCGKPRGQDGTDYYCRPCADERAAQARRRYERKAALALTSKATAE